MRKESSLTEADLQKEKERLVRELKKHIKHVMEESVAKKTVHEESSNVSAVCSTLDTCLSLGLRRRSLGLFKTSSTAALLHKISKENEDAGAVLARITDIERGEHEGGRRKSSSSSDSLKSFSSTRGSINKTDSSSNLISSSSNRFYWIRIALFEKRLHKIVSYLTQNADRFYDSRRALVSDPDYGPLLSSLLVGPCALEYSKATFADQYWVDPPADELVQRHRISSMPRIQHCSLPSTPVRHAFKRTISAQPDLEERRSSIPHQARDYVESLHQNRKAALLYGKNNVVVLHSDRSEPLPGYLSLHQETGSSVILKWTPNSLMDPRVSADGLCGSPHSPGGPATWDLAIQVNIASILHIHCHQERDSSGSLIMVGVDGVQLPPFSFPPGESLVSFLACLETAVRPRGILVPPLRSQKSEDNRNDDDIGPLLAKSDCLFKISLTETSESENGHVFLEKTNSMEWITNLFNRKVRLLTRSDSITLSEYSSEALDKSEEDTRPLDLRIKEGKCEQATSSPSVPLKGLCNTMRNQLISRAFYGWLSHCRHMRTVRSHLQGLVIGDYRYSETHRSTGTGSGQGLTSQMWADLKLQGLQRPEVQQSFYRSVYSGGIEHELRPLVWQYMLGHLDWGDSLEERNRKDGEIQAEYERKISDWGALEAIVLQQDREITAANIARMSHDGRTDSSNDNVFEAAESEQDYPASPTPERPSTISEVTEHSTRSKLSSSASSSANLSMENKRLERRFNQPVSTSDEGVEDLNEEDVTETESPAVASTTMAPFGYKITTPSIDSGNPDSSPPDGKLDEVCEVRRTMRRHSMELPPITSSSSSCSREITDITRKISSLSKDFRDDLLIPGGTVSTCPSPASSEGGTYSLDLLESFGLNLHRIDKDVARCDRNLPYFSKTSNLDKLRNVITTYVWENLEEGYMQGMCDLVAPLLVVLDDEAIVFSCFRTLMKRMIRNFPNGDQMDTNFANMRALMQVLDQGLYDAIQQNGDFSHFYFCYRWFLLDFKREFDYSSVYLVWETIWAAQRVASPDFYLFIALGLVETYRDIILDRNMDFTDIIKFFNEMAERHDTRLVLDEAKLLLDRLHRLVLDL